MIKNSVIYRLVFLAFVFVGNLSFGQTDDYKLADHYLSQEEYAKAKSYLEKIVEYDDRQIYFEKYMICLDQLGETKEMEKVLKKRFQRNPAIVQYGIDLALFYQTHEEPKKANQIYNDLMDEMQPRARSVIDLYNAFRKVDDRERAFQVLQKGRRLLKNNYPLNVQFADYYGSIGDNQNMIKEYLELIEYHPSYINSVKKVMLRQIDFANPEDEVATLLKNELLKKTQKNPGNTEYAEMLTWYFIQTKKFNAAFLHLKAEDKKYGHEGNRIMSFGTVCVRNGDYAVARKCYQYMIDLGKSNRYYWLSRYRILNVLYLQIKYEGNNDPGFIKEVITMYKESVVEMEAVQNVVDLKYELAELLAYYGNDADAAVDILRAMIQDQGMTDMDRAKMKMALADIFVLKGEVWEASLLYMQVDSKFKYEVIGQEAKFKNARIFYYDGEFEFAQSQLDVLKQATSKLISNDAIELSVLLTENYGLDSNYTAMYNYAQAELLVEQHKYTEAYALLDSILNEFPGHSLGDEIVFKKARIEEKKGNYPKAIEYYEELLKYYNNDILADNALFYMARIYDQKLMNKEKALEYYKKIIFEHKGSFFTDEARTRILELRN